MNTSLNDAATMTPQDALHWISEVFEEVPGRIDASTPRSDVPGWDSLGTLSLIAALDEKFDIQLSEKEIGALQHISDIIDILRRNGAVQD